MFDFITEWLQQLHSTFIETGYWEFIFIGLGNTLLITVGAVAIGFLLGTFVAIGKYAAAHNRRLKFIDVICNVYLAVIRGTPVTVQLMIMFFIIFASVKEGLWVAILTFGINSGAYTAEIIRSGISSIDPGQEEAGRSLGLSSAQTMMTIILPQAIKNILPTLGNEFIALIKETSVVSFVGALDLYVAFSYIGSNSYEFMVPYIAMALIYIVIVCLITLLVKIMERSLKKSDRRN